MRFILGFVFILTAGCIYSQNIIPYPNYYKQQEKSVRIPKKITISSKSAEFRALIPDFIGTAHTMSIHIKEKKCNKGFIHLKKNKKLTNQEQYHIVTTPKGITIEAGHINGCFYGLQSALQMIYASDHGGYLNCSVIQDEPRYPWRGIMLDESRHFMGMEEVKKTLDFMALHKLNKFHWHLTDASGWRIEIKQYPLLTTIGGIGNHTNPEAPTKFYTQDEVREIVEYANRRFIEVIPEIDMPGHATAAVKAYPEFSGGGSSAYPDFTFNPGKEGTYTFLTNILKEVTTLFPSKYIHVGGDEVHFGNEAWHTLPEVQSLMDKSKLNDLKDVELYFIKRMSDSIAKMDKFLIGWDEVTKANLPKNNTVVMWWRHDKPQQLTEAMQTGYQVVLCPRLPLYFDFDQHQSHKYGRRWSQGAFASLEDVYHFPGKSYTPIVSVSNPLILGIQGNIWTERIHTNERLQFMTYPRLSALAEAAWTYSQNKDIENFNDRMNWMYTIYKQQGVVFFDYKNPNSSPDIAAPSTKPIE